MHIPFIAGTSLLLLVLGVIMLAIGIAYLLRKKKSGKLWFGVALFLIGLIGLWIAHSASAAV